MRDALWGATRDLCGKEFEKALLDFSRKDPVFKGIRRVRVREGLKVIPVCYKSCVAYKGYKGDANARFDVWQLPDGKWTAAVVSMFDAHRHDFIRSEEHTSELQSLMRISYAVFCLQKKNHIKIIQTTQSQYHRYYY